MLFENFQLGSYECGKFDIAENRIVGGQGAFKNSIPWQVNLVSGDWPKSFQKFCGGAIIDETHILTAAHCVVERNRYGSPPNNPNFKTSFHIHKRLKTKCR